MNARTARPGSRRGRHALWFAVGVLLSVLCVTAGGIWGTLGSVPVYSTRRVEMPSPNALDDFADAAALMPTRRVTLGPADLPRLSTPELRDYVRLCRPPWPRHAARSRTATVTRRSPPSHSSFPS